jgi:AcrR family transcriptional regulator
MATRARGRPAEADITVISDDKLLEAVLQAFGENGFEGTSIREIARRLDVSHNLIPQRFGSKRRLWYAAVDYGFGKFDTEMIREGEALGSDDLVILRGLLVHTIEMTAANPSLLQIINQEASQPGPRLDYLFEAFIKPASEFLEVWLDKLVAEGRVTKTSVAVLYFLVTHGAGGLFALPALAKQFSAFIPEKDADNVHAQAELVVSILFDGILPR